MQKKRFIKNSMLMTFFTVLTNTAAIIFNVYISDKIGAEGMGVFRLGMTVFVFFASFVTSGLTLAVTRLTADFLALGKYTAARRAVAFCSLTGAAIGSLTAVVLYLFADDIGNGFLGDARTALPIRVLAFKLPFLAVSSCFGGYFLAVRSVIKAASDDIFELVIEVIVCVSILPSFSERGTGYACCAAALSAVIAEIASCMYSALLYSIDIRKYTMQGSLPKHTTKRLFSIAMPVMGSSCLRSGLSMLENTLIPSGLKQYGLAADKALAEYGIITGMAVPVLIFPSSVLCCLSSLMIPEMSEANAARHTEGISRMAKKVLRATFLFTIPVTVFFLVFGERLSAVIYNRNDVGIYIKLLALTVPFLYLDRVVDGMLKGLNQQVYYFTYNIIDSVTRVVLTFILVPSFGIRAIIAVMFVSAILNSSLSTYRLLKTAAIELDVGNWIIKPAIASFAVAMAVNWLIMLF